MSQFKQSVINIVSLIPYGKVVSYGQVALYIGVPRAARQVGWILNGLEGSVLVPWWRVVNNEGRISIKGSQYSAEEQRRLLLKEGLKVKEDLTFNIEEYRFKPDEEFIRSLQLDPVYLDSISDRIYFSKQK